MKALSRSSAFSNLIISLAVTSDCFSGSRWSSFLYFSVFVCVCVCRCCSPVLLFPTKEAVKWDDERNEAAEGLNCCHGVSEWIIPPRKCTALRLFSFFCLSCPESLQWRSAVIVRCSAPWGFAAQGSVDVAGCSLEVLALCYVTDHCAWAGKKKPQHKVGFREGVGEESVRYRQTVILKYLVSTARPMFFMV